MFLLSVWSAKRDAVSQKTQRATLYDCVCVKEDGHIYRARFKPRSKRKNKEGSQDSVARGSTHTRTCHRRTAYCSNRWLGCCCVLPVARQNGSWVFCSTCLRDHASFSRRNLRSAGGEVPLVCLKTHGLMFCTSWKICVCVITPSMYLPWWFGMHVSAAWSLQRQGPHQATLRARSWHCAKRCASHAAADAVAKHSGEG